VTPPALDWRSVERKLTRIRVLVHAYLDVDHERVAEAIRLAPGQFAEYVRQAARWLAERSDAV
jgi:uncharacterized protein YutE (UPF0331/DUF86 family)